MMMDNACKVIIIGAGVSGLAAAQELISQNIMPIVLEARDRIGGRVYTNRDHFGFPMDFGASFIHGIEGNIIYDIVKKNEIEVVGYEDTPNTYDCCTGEQIDPDLCDTEYEKMKQFVNDCLIEQFSSLGSDVSFKDALQQVMLKEELMIEDPIRKRLWQCYMNDIFGGFNSAELREVGAKYFFQNSKSIDDVYSNEDVIFPDGYSQIIDHMAKNVDIRLNHIVSRIDYSQSDLVVLTLSDGRQIQCSKVIITVPLGVLKQRQIEFIPPLPQKKMEAIQCLGYGITTKMILEFESAFWDENVPCFSLLPSLDEDVNPFYIVNWKRYTGRNILMVFITGSIAKQIHQQSDEQSVKQVVQLLRQALNRVEFSDPIRTKVLNWGNDPFSLGAYSYISIGTDSNTFEQLAESVDRVLFFAGEATSSEGFGYVHGAYHTGIREARKVISCLDT